MAKSKPAVLPSAKKTAKVGMYKKLVGNKKK